MAILKTKLDVEGVCRIRSTALKQFTSGFQRGQLVSDIASKGYIQEYRNGQAWEQELARIRYYISAYNVLRN